MNAVYFNEFDKFAASWLRNLFPESVVDERSINDVGRADTAVYKRCHFFGGIGGWEYALQLAGWPEDRPVWTGSCPCQPFSSAGKQKGQEDERHLWPEMFRLIRECRPEVIFGEQVASSEVVGTELEASFIVAVQAGEYARANKLAKQLSQSRNFHFHKRWLSGVRSDLEGEGYSMRWKILGAHSVGSPHIRQRLYWVAHMPSQRWNIERDEQDASKWSQGKTGACCSDGRLGESNCDRRSERFASASSPRYRDSVVATGDIHRMAIPHGTELQRITPAGEQSIHERCDRACGMGDTPLESRQRNPGGLLEAEAGVGGARVFDGSHAIGSEHAGAGMDSCRLGQSFQSRLEGHSGNGDGSHESRWLASQEGRSASEAGPANFWSDFRIVHCTDGKARRTGRSVFPLVNGIPREMGRGQPELGKLVKGARNNRVGRLKGYGNAIVPQVAAEFIRAFLESEAEMSL